MRETETMRKRNSHLYMTYCTCGGQRTTSEVIFLLLPGVLPRIKLRLLDLPTGTCPLSYLETVSYISVTLKMNR